MSPIERSADTFDVLCIAARGGTLGIAAADVIAVREADTPSDEAPALDLAQLLGPGGRDAAVRRVRVAAGDVPPFDLVTDGVLSVRTVARSALQPVPSWLVPLVASLGADRLLLEPDALVLLADPARLASMCANVGSKETCHE